MGGKKKQKIKVLVLFVQQLNIGRGFSSVLKHKQKV